MHLDTINDIEFGSRRPRRRHEHTAVDEFTAAAPELGRCAYRAAYKILGDPGLSEDVTQEAMVRALTKWEVIAAYAPAWVTRVASNLAIDVWRRNRTVATDQLDRPFEDWTDLHGQHDELARALARLPRRRAEVIVLRFLCDYSPEQTALAIGTSVAGVLKHTVRGLADLRRLMGAPQACEPSPGNFACDDASMLAISA